MDAPKRLDNLTASAFSTFQYFDVEEKMLSSIFADLLRPYGSHGQGATFLRLFLKEIDRGDRGGLRKMVDYGKLERCEVLVEYATSNGRYIDILLRSGSGGQWIGIENKPWAQEQPCQLQDYLSDLQERDPLAGILYLSGSGEDSQTINEDESERYLMISYGYRGEAPSIAHWIEQCESHCQADKVRWFLRELRDYIDRTFYAEPPLEEEEKPNG